MGEDVLGFVPVETRTKIKESNLVDRPERFSRDRWAISISIPLPRCVAGRLCGRLPAAFIFAEADT